MPIGEIVRFDALEYLPVTVEIVRRDAEDGRATFGTKTVYVPKMMIKDEMTHDELCELESMILDSISIEAWARACVYIHPHETLMAKPIIIMFPIFSDEV